MGKRHLAISQKGFSLVEILVVLAIIGGIMTLLAPRIFENRDKANMRTAKIMVNKIKNAVASYYTDCEQMPESLDQLANDPGEGACENWGPSAYIKEKELKDPWGNPFEFSVNGSEVIVKSFGADGTEGGSKLNRDISTED